MTEFQNYLTTPSVVRNLCIRRKRSIESFVKTVTEVWMGGYLRGIIVNDLTRRLETEEDLMPDSGDGNTWRGNVTATVDSTRREYFWPEVETPRDDLLQSNLGSHNLVRAEPDYSPICVPLCIPTW